MQEASSETSKDEGQLGADDQGDVYGLIVDIDTLEELLEELDDLNLTTRSQVRDTLALAQDRAGDREADDLAVRLENVLSAMNDYDLTSREDVEARMSALDAEAEAIDAGETTLEI